MMISLGEKTDGAHDFNSITLGKLTPSAAAAWRKPDAQATAGIAQSVLTHAAA